MQRLASLLPATILIASTAGCCLFRPGSAEPQALGEMHEVLGTVREELIKLRNSYPEEEKIGLAVGKLTGTFKVIRIDSAKKSLTLGITKPAGEAGIESQRQSTLENTIIVEFVPPVATIEKCGKDGKDSSGRGGCKPGDLVAVPGAGADKTIMMMQVRPEPL